MDMVQLSENCRATTRIHFILLLTTQSPGVSGINFINPGGTNSWMDPPSGFELRTSISDFTSKIYNWAELIFLMRQNLSCFISRGYFSSS